MPAHERQEKLRARLAEVESLINPLIAPQGLEVVVIEQGTEARQPILRVCIDRIDAPGTVTLQDCVSVTHQLEGLAALEAAMPGHFNLEVSSPGVDRPLVKERDFLRAVGEKALLQTLEPLDGRKRFSGRIQSVQDGMITLDMGREGRVSLSLNQLQKANLKPDFADLLKRANAIHQGPAVELDVDDEDDPETSFAAEASDRDDDR